MYFPPFLGKPCVFFGWEVPQPGAGVHVATHRHELSASGRYASRELSIQVTSYQFIFHPINNILGSSIIYG